MTVRGLWEKPVLAYLCDRFGSAEIICRPDEIEREKKDVDLLIKTAQGLVAVEHTLFNFLTDQEYADVRIDKVRSWIMANVEPNQGIRVCVPQNMLVDRSLEKHKEEIGPLVAKAASKLPSLPRNWNGPVRSERIDWRGHQISVSRSPRGGRNRMARSTADVDLPADVKRVIKEKLPEKLFRAPRRYKARPFLVLETNQIAFSHISLGEEVMKHIKKLGVPQGFHLIIMDTYEEPQVVAVWNERGERWLNA